MDNKEKFFIMTDRDNEIIETLKTLKIMTSSQIQRLFFTSQPLQCRRCKKLVDNKKIKSYRDDRNPFAETRFYYKRKPTQQERSMLAISEFYVRLKTSPNLEIIDFQREYSVEVCKGFTIRPDAKVVVKYEDMEYEFFIEVDNTKRLSVDKYYKALKNGYYPPTIISISNHPMKNYNCLDIIRLDMELNNFNKLIDEYFS
ncbi:MAG: hypothetical protein ACRDA3_13215 [Peptostreptococcaceae bacterium]